jgi:hypothetical protein
MITLHSSARSGGAGYLTGYINFISEFGISDLSFANLCNSNTLRAHWKTCQTSLRESQFVLFVAFKINVSSWIILLLMDLSQTRDLKLNVFTPAEFDEIAKHTELLKRSASWIGEI